MPINIKPVILSGGSGTRLWPLSRESFPKQFAPLFDGESLFGLTIRRAISLNTPICITNEEHRFFVRELLKQATANLEASILLEPVGRNTAAAMACATFMPNVADSDILLFLPCDHFVPDINAFISTMQSGVDAARSGYIVTFGVQTSFPSTAYGYIQKGSKLNVLGVDLTSTYEVTRFVEKPPVDKAEIMLLSGDYLWNAGIFLCQAGVLKNALKQYAPDILKSSQLAMQFAEVDGDYVRPDKEEFLACRSESIDYAVIEHFKKVAVVPFKGVWSDVGSWNVVGNLLPSDELGNRINGQGLAVDSKNTYINAPHRLVVALGTDDLVIVDTLDAVLVASSDKVEKVKDVVVQLKKEGKAQATIHRRVGRPWGWYDSIDMGDCFQVKRIAVRPGASLSLQMHHHRAEHWIVVKGIAKVTNGEDVFLLEENQSTYIPVGVRHRLENPGNTDLEMIEVQTGSYLGEDDIVRFEDTYGRS
jgi:mannose-1-phosphate guanylyltransferase / mannose-6-phosphate isomerase